jgi:hypothetical protein
MFTNSSFKITSRYSLMAARHTWFNSSPYTNIPTIFAHLAIFRQTRFELLHPLQTRRLEFREPSCCYRYSTNVGSENQWYRLLLWDRPQFHGAYSSMHQSWQTGIRHDRDSDLLTLRPLGTYVCTHVRNQDIQMWIRRLSGNLLCFQNEEKLGELGGELATCYITYIETRH